MAKEQMKLFDPCIAIGKNTFNLSEEDAAAIVEQMRNVAKGITQGDVQVRVKKIMRAESAMQKKWVKQKKLQIKLNKLKDTKNFNRIIDSLSERENLKRTNPGLYRRIMKMLGKDPKEELGLTGEVRARYTGSFLQRRGGQDSAADRMLAAERSNVGYMLREMLRGHNMTEKEFYKWVDDEQNLIDVVKEQFGPNGEGFNLETPTRYTNNDRAYTFAKARVMLKKKWVDLANREGAMIGWLPNHVITQYHDPIKIFKAGKDQWIADQLEFIGTGTEAETRTFGMMDEVQRRQFLDAAWTNIVEGKRTSIDEAPQVKVPGNLAKRMSQHRKIHYGSDENWLANFNKYGSGDLKYSMFSELKNLSDEVILLQEFGSNPELSQKNLWDKLEAWAANPPDGKLRSFNRITIENHWKWVSGESYHIANPAGYGPSLATATQSYLALQNMSKLGGSLFPSFSDLSTSVQTYRYHGIDYLKGIHDHFENFSKKLSQDERTEVLYQLAEYNDMILGGFHSRYALDNPRAGFIARMQDQFFKLNLLAGWTYNNRAAAQFVMSGNIARNLTGAFNDLNPNLRRVLQQYNIGEADWEIMRDLGVKTIDENGTLLPDTTPTQELDLNRKQYFTPDILEDAADAPGMTLGDQKAMRDLSMKMRNFFVQEGRTAIPEPGAADRAFMLQGSQRGTFTRTFFEALVQFRSFPIVYLRKLGPRYAQQGTLYTIGNLAAMTMIGYVSMSAKDLLKGKELKPTDDPRTWAGAFVFSGAGGILGDFIFNDFQGYGKGVMDVVGGPTGDLIQDWATWLTALAKGDDAAAKAFNNAIRMAPYANLWYTRTILDYMFIYNIENFLNPGVLRRREKRMKRDYNQIHSPMMKPSTSPLRRISPLYQMGIR